MTFMKNSVGFTWFTLISLTFQLIFPINDISKIFTGPREDFCPQRHQVCWAPWEAPPDQEEMCGPWGSQAHLHRSVLQWAGPEQYHWYSQLKHSSLFLSQQKILISLLPQFIHSNLLPAWLFQPRLLWEWIPCVWCTECTNKHQDILWPSMFLLWWYLLMQGWACYIALKRSVEIFEQENNNEFCANNPSKNHGTPKTRKEFLCCPMIVQILPGFSCDHSNMDKGNMRER